MAENNSICENLGEGHEANEREKYVFAIVEDFLDGSRKIILATDE